MKCEVLGLRNMYHNSSGAVIGNFRYVRDRSGNIRKAVDSTGTVRTQYDYDPYGTGASNQITSNPASKTIAANYSGLIP